MDFLDPVLDHLVSHPRVGWVHKMLTKGTCADRQLAVFEKTKSLGWRRGIYSNLVFRRNLATLKKMGLLYVKTKQMVTHKIQRAS